MGDVLMLLVLIPLLAALLMLFLPKNAKPILRGVALVGTIIPTLFALVAYIGFAHGQAGYQDLYSANWFTLNNAFAGGALTVHFAFAADGIAMPLIMLVGVVSILAVIRNFSIQERVKGHYFWMLTLIAGLYGVFAASDLFTFFFFLEATLVASFFLILGWGNEKKQKAATKFLLYRGFASVVLLGGLIGLAYSFATQLQAVSAYLIIPNEPNYLTLSLTEMAHFAAQVQIPAATQGVLFLVFLLAVMIEEAFVPFHTWLPDTHQQADTGTNMLIGGALMKVGLYALLRFAVTYLPQGLKEYGTLVAVLGVISILYGALVAIASRDWRRLIAFSSISHMGLVLLAIGSMQVIGLQGAVFMLVSSGLLTALMFFTVGAQAERTQTFAIGELGGLSKPLPVISGVMLVAALGLVGLPGMSGFISEFTLFVGSFAKFPALSLVATLGMIFAALYLLFAIQRTTFGPQKGEFAALKDATAIEFIPMVVLVGLVVAIGVYPSLLGDVVHGTVQALAARIGG